jgi:hypothetical protein
MILIGLIQLKSSMLTQISALLESSAIFIDHLIKYETDAYLIDGKEMSSILIIKNKNSSPWKINSK